MRCLTLGKVVMCIAASAASAQPCAVDWRFAGWLNAGGYYPASLAPDAARSRVLSAAVRSEGQYVVRVDAWDGVAWTPWGSSYPLGASPSGPSPRAIDAVVDSARDRLVCWPVHATGWPVGEVNLASGQWSVPSSTGNPPIPRSGHRMVYHPEQRRTLMYGGATNSGGPTFFFGDAWWWNGASWAREPAVAPPARTDHGMVYDPDRARVIVFGGEGPSGTGGGGTLGAGYFFQDTWEFDGSRWTRVSTTGPAPRSRHTMYHDPVLGVTVMYGGVGSVDGQVRTLTDAWAWNGSSWTPLVLNVPSKPVDAAAVFDASRGRVVALGGRESHQQQWFWPLDTWELASAPPAITRSPVSRRVHGGTALELTAGAEGVGTLQFRWRRNGQALSDGGRVWGAATSLLRIDPADASDSGVYDCVVTNACGSATTPLATITVLCLADLNGDGVTDFNDLLEYLNLFNLPCP